MESKIFCMIVVVNNKRLFLLRLNVHEMGLCIFLVLCFRLNQGGGLSDFMSDCEG